MTEREWRFGLLNEGGSGEIAAIFLGDSNDVVMTSYNRAALERAAEAVNERATLRQQRDDLLEALKGFRRAHLVVDDCWYSCPLATDEDGESAFCGDPTDRCDCGADETNARIDSLIKRITDAETGTEDDS